MPNRLAQETSPYLRQHADNPVDWWPWSPEAFAEARRRDCPVLVSIGYAACHWCHVMAHESFEDPAIAALMNEHFVNIKVDREERPDIDQVHLAALQALGEQGGWPLTMFLTPDGAPFWGGTYFPPEPRWGRPSFRNVLAGLTAAYRDKRGDVASTASALKTRLARATYGDSRGLSLAQIDEVGRGILGIMDPVAGGIRGAPKFPNAMLLETLWRVGHRTGETGLTDSFLLTLRRISNGGIYDHIGGGFARYSTDAEWLVPHFEKMLYDNALLLELLALGWEETGDDLFRRRAGETVKWLTREMLLPDGVFAASLDADSPGGEGAFYVWTPAELETALGSEDAAFFARWYDISGAGNWEGRSIPNRTATPEASAEEEARLAALREKLLAVRDRRPHPARDDKALADWNGLLIAALVRAAMVFGRGDWLDLARIGFAAARRLFEREGRLGHSWKDGRLLYPGFAADLAAMARAAVALHEATGDNVYLTPARAWLDGLWNEHWSSGRLYMTAADGEALVVRPEAMQDDAVPSAMGLFAEAALRYAVAANDEEWRGRSETLLTAGAERAATLAMQHLTIVNAVDLRLGGVEILVTGQGPEADVLAQAALAVPFPVRIVHRLAPGAALAAAHPAATAVSVKPQALVCAGDRCSLPVTTPDALRGRVKEMLSALQS
ncbi:MAG TPA: thioredoxin domain-containing protein [Hyphomicrobiales bacterium]|nr:thioredoxin domain-containing protein [Hyphomicrobiales bacterium]